MKRRFVLMLISANLLVLVALAFVYPHLMISPGALINSHADLKTDCFACHTPWRGATAERCITCHALSDIGLRTTKGAPFNNHKVQVAFHQELLEQDCMACHSDHAGPTLTQRSRKPFSHSLLRATVRDHCKSCHAAPKNVVHHNLTAGCGQCHSQEHWKPATYDHDTYFVLDHDHNASCATCHTNSDYSRYTCYGCHEHTPDNIRDEHLEEGIRSFENCVKCHRNASDKPEKGKSRRDRKPD